MASCPKCLDVELVKGECLECGWRPRGGSGGKGGGSGRSWKDPNPREVQCALHQGMLQCVLFATSYPNGSRGFCWLHADEARRLTGPELHDQLQDIREHRHRYLAERAGVDEIQVRMADLIEANPQWHRGAEEGARAYGQRMVGLCRHLGAEVREKQHVAAPGDV